MREQLEPKAPSRSEKMVLQALIKYLSEGQIENIEYEPNAKKKNCSNIPDYIFEYKEKNNPSRIINFEIVACVGYVRKCSTDKNNLEKAHLQDPLKKFKKKLNESDTKWIKNNETITIIPITKIPSKKDDISLSKLKKPLLKKLKAEYEADNIPTKNWTEEGKKEWNKKPSEYNITIFVKEKEFKFSVTKANHPPRKEKEQPIGFLPSILEEFDSKESQAKFDIKNSIEEKTQKLEEIKGEKWLGIHNRNHFLDKNDFIKAYEDLIKKGFSHTFTRIFVIFSDNDLDIDSDIVELT